MRAVTILEFFCLKAGQVTLPRFPKNQKETTYFLVKVTLILS